MKSPTTESSFKLIEAVGALLRCEELQRDDVSESTHELIEGVLETVGQVQRECEFPERAKIIEFFAKRFAEENREMLVKRVVALVGTLSDEELYSSYQEARESECGRGQGRRRVPAAASVGRPNHGVLAIHDHDCQPPALSVIVATCPRVGAIFESLLAAWIIRTLSVGRWGGSGAIAAGLKRIWRENSRKPAGTSVEARSRKSKCEFAR